MESEEHQTEWEYIKELLDINRENLRSYERQRARGTTSAPIHVIDGEIKRLKREIAALEHKLFSLERPREPIGDEAVEPGGLQPVRSYRPSMGQGWSFWVQQGGGVWMFDGDDIEIFELKRDAPIERWHLPQVRWKTWLPQVWQDGLVCSDWAGNLWHFARNGGGYGQQLYSARYSDLPFH